MQCPWFGTEMQWEMEKRVEGAQTMLMRKERRCKQRRSGADARLTAAPNVAKQSRERAERELTCDKRALRVESARWGMKGARNASSRKRGMELTTANRVPLSLLDMGQPCLPVTTIASTQPKAAMQTEMMSRIIRDHNVEHSTG
ncbi:predicted protein [Plenodomus lingam JN3]|uniref:Predicted protein n=1 Tax=Leptosphaeria maculans (strain JN3 / isolate v23.1.3 / race Av1-4-5-6-7-8) TaxID=985895 RepID=E4ZNE1_LEPMJ|nr:predicted protein [Plenodomus lingam JN3]CBX93000.1 predicted protein [Plenodomus lingam JN3]